MIQQITLDDNPCFQHIKTSFPEIFLGYCDKRSLLTHAFKQNGLMKVCTWRFCGDSSGRTIFTLEDDLDIELQLQKHHIIIPKYITADMQLETAIAQFNNNSSLFRGDDFNYLWFNNNNYNGYNDCIKALKNIQEYDKKDTYSDVFFAKRDNLMLSKTIRLFLNSLKIKENTTNTRRYYNDICDVTTNDGVILTSSILPYFIETIQFMKKETAALPDPSFLRLDFVV